MNRAADVLPRAHAALRNADGFSITDDDVAVEDSLYTTGRRGVAGTLVVEKITGAAAEQGAGLAALKALGDHVNKATRSMGVALTSCTVPAAGKPTFQIGEAEVAHDPVTIGEAIVAKKAALAEAALEALYRLKKLQVGDPT